MTILSGATLQVPAGGNLLIYGDITANGTIVGNGTLEFRGAALTNNGAVSTANLLFNRSDTQSIGGNGLWTSSSWTIKSPLGSSNDITVEISTLTIPSGGRLALGSSNLTINGPTTINLTASSPGSSAEIIGSGKVRTVGAVTIVVSGSGNSRFSAPLEVVSGTTTASTEIYGTFSVITVLSDAVLEISGGKSLRMNENLTVYGTVDGNGTLDFKGPAVSNDGTIRVSSFLFNGSSSQSLTGSGSFVNNIVTIATSTGLNSDHQMSSIVVNSSRTFDISNRTLSLSGSGTPLTINGTLSLSGSTIVYNGTQAQTAATLNYNNLTINNPAGVSLAQNVTVNGTLTLLSGVFNIGERTLTLNGNVIATGGSLNSEYNGTVVYNQASAGQPVLAATYGNLTLNNADKTFTGAITATVNNLLTLDADLIMDANSTLVMGSSATSTGNGDVVGRVKRYGPFTANYSYSFGNRFVSITFAPGGTLPSKLTLTLAKFAPVGLSPAVPRVYTIEQNGGSGFSSVLRLRYLDAELGGIVEDDLQLWRYDTDQSIWIEQTATNRSTIDNWVERSGVTNFSNWALAAVVTPPAAPSDLSATAVSASQINLSWTDNSDNEDGFKVERSLDGSTWTQIATVGANVTTYQNTGLSCSTIYYYRVSAYNAGGDSDYSNTAYATTYGCAPTPPTAPSDLSATAASASQINLSWTDNSGDEDGFRVERWDGSSWVEIATVGVDSTAYQDANLACNTTYYYRVRAYNAGGNSAYSNTAWATTDACPPLPPAAPSDLSATAASASQINLSWTDNSGDEDGFKVERSLDGSTWTQVAAVGTNVTFYQDVSLTCGTTYYYRVKAYNEGGDSDYSNLAYATTNACRFVYLPLVLCPTSRQ